MDFIEVEIKAGKNKGTEENPFLREALKIMPLYLKKEDTDTPIGQEGELIKVYYNRLNQAAIPAVGYEASNDLAISFIIKKSQLDKFKKYLNIEFTVDAIWVSQFNATVFGNCTCYNNKACCFFSSQYIVKNSTGSYSRNGSQIATMKFPINNAPLIDMQTPVSLPSGFSQAVAYLNAKLTEGKPIVVGVYYRERQEKQVEKTATAQEALNKAQEKLDEFNEEIENTEETESLLKQREVLEVKVANAQQKYDNISQAGPFNTIEPTFHYVVVVGKGFDVDRQRFFYRFYEVGTSNQSNGTHELNRLYIYDDKLMGSQGFSSKEYIVTEVRQHSQSGSDCPK